MEGTSAAGAGWIVSERTFGDLELQFEFQLRGNDGFRVGLVNRQWSMVNGQLLKVDGAGGELISDPSPRPAPPSGVKLESDAARGGEGGNRGGDLSLVNGQLSLVIEIVPSVGGSGGLIDAATGRCLRPSDPLGQLQLKVSGWNDLRIKLVDGRLTAWLNNWPLIEYSGGELPASERRIAYELIGHGPQRVAFRNVRIKELAAEP